MFLEVLSTISVRLFYRANFVARIKSYSLANQENNYGRARSLFWPKHFLFSKAFPISVPLSSEKLVSIIVMNPVLHRPDHLFSTEDLFKSISAEKSHLVQGYTLSQGSLHLMTGWCGHMNAGRFPWTWGNSEGPSQILSSLGGQPTPRWDCFAVQFLPLLSLASFHSPSRYLSWESSLRTFCMAPWRIHPVTVGARRGRKQMR